jgi:hypothetical protein
MQRMIIALFLLVLSAASAGAEPECPPPPEGTDPDKHMAWLQWKTSELRKAYKDLIKIRDEEFLPEYANHIAKIDGGKGETNNNYHKDFWCLRCQVFRKFTAFVDLLNKEREATDVAVGDYFSNPEFTCHQVRKEADKAREADPGPPGKARPTNTADIRDLFGAGRQRKHAGGTVNEGTNVYTIVAGDQLGYIAEKLAPLLGNPPPAIWGEGGLVAILRKWVQNNSGLTNGIYPGDTIDLDDVACDFTKSCPAKS